MLASAPFGVLVDDPLGEAVPLGVPLVPLVGEPPPVVVLPPAPVVAPIALAVNASNVLEPLVGALMAPTIPFEQCPV